MKKFLLNTSAALVAALGFASAVSADGWGGTGGDWAGQVAGIKVTTMQAGDGVANSYNEGHGTNRFGFSESFAEQDLTTDVKSSTFLGDPDCTTCKNDSTVVKQNLFQRTGGLAYQYSEGGDSSASHASVGSSGLTTMATIAERYKGTTQALDE